MSITKHLDREINLISTRRECPRGSSPAEPTPCTQVRPTPRRLDDESKPKPARSASSATSVCRPSSAIRQRVAFA